MASVLSPKGVDTNLNTDDPSTWSKSKKKRMRQKRKKVEGATDAASNANQTPGNDKSSNDASDSINLKRQRTAPSEAAIAQTKLPQVNRHMNSDVTNSSNHKVGPKKSPKKKKKKKKCEKQIPVSPAHHGENSASGNDQNEKQPSSSNNKQPSNDNQAHTTPQSQPKPMMLSTLQKTFLARLTSSRFRELNEELYTQPSHQSFAQFTSKPELFEQYHLGFRRQVEEWPVNPVDVIYKKIVGGYKKHVGDSVVTVADFGCGDAKLAERLLALQLNENGNLSPKPTSAKMKKAKKSGMCPFKVHSFDLVSGGNPLVTPADMTNVPLSDESVDIGVYCLALMGTNVPDFIREGWRVLKVGGILRVAEVRSRFEASVDDGKKTGKHQSSKSKTMKTGDHVGEVDNPKPLMILDDFKSLMERCGFRCTHVDQSNKMFLFMDFVKLEGSSGLSIKESFSAKPCIYKRR